MSNLNRKFLLALFAALVISGCSSTPEDTSPIEEEEAVTATETTEETEADSASVVEGGTAGEEYGAQQAVDPALEQRVVYFDFDKATVRSDAVATLQAHAAYLSKTPAARIRVEGHADERGTREYNIALGERRAKATISFLVANGASVSQLEAVSYGEERPVALGHDEASWAENRRSELKYTAEAP